MTRLGLDKSLDRYINKKQVTTNQVRVMARRLSMEKWTVQAKAFIASLLTSRLIEVARVRDKDGNARQAIHHGLEPKVESMGQLQGMLYLDDEVYRVCTGHFAFVFIAICCKQLLFGRVSQYDWSSQYRFRSSTKVTLSVRLSMLACFRCLSLPDPGPAQSRADIFSTLLM
jgi:hypothetical protein